MKTEIELLECYAESYKTRSVEALNNCLNDTICYITPPDEKREELTRADFLQRLNERFDGQNELIPIECVEITIMTVEPTGENIICMDAGVDRIFISIEANKGMIEKITVSRETKSSLKLNKIILKWPDKLFYEDSGKILIMPKNNPRKVIDTILASSYPQELCIAYSFEPDLIVKLIKEGFCFMSIIDLPRSLCMATAWHHLSRSIIFLDHIHIKRTVKHLLHKYELRVNVEFDRIVDNCIKQHGAGWMTPFWRETVNAIRAMNRNDVIWTSFGLYDNGELVAGEFGTITGRIYSSYSGYYDVNNTGTIQMILTAQYLKEEGFAFLDLGVPLQYKSALGAKTLNLESFIKLWRMHCIEAPQKGAGCTPFPAPPKKLSAVELLNIFKDAFRYFYFDDLKEYLADNFHMENRSKISTYFFSKWRYKWEYLSSLAGTLRIIQILGERLFMQIVYDTRSGAPYLFMHLDKNNALFVPQIKDGKFTRIDLCMPDLYQFSPHPSKVCHKAAE